MRKKVARLAKGYLDQKQPAVHLSQPHIEETVASGQSFRGELRVECGDQLGFRGIIYADDDRIELPEDQFGGGTAVIPYILHAEKIRGNETVCGLFSLVTSAGELEIPFHFEVRQPELRQEGLPETLEDLRYLAEEKPEVLQDFFESEHFTRQLWLREEDSLRALYEGLRRSSDSRQALEEFLIACGIREETGICADTTLHAYALTAQQDRAELLIEKQGEGWISVTAKAEGGFLAPAGEHLLNADFEGNICRLPVIFNKKRMKAGKNRGLVTVSSGRRYLTIPVEAEDTGRKNEKALSKTIREKALALEKAMLALYISKSPEEDAEPALEARQQLADAAGESISLRVLKAELLRKAGRGAEERELLGELRTEVQRGRAKEPVAYLWFLYLEALLGTSRDSVAGAARMVIRYAEEGLDGEGMFLLQLRMEDLMAEPPEAILRKLRGFAEKGLSTELLLEACRFYNSHPEFLMQGDEFERKVLLFGARCGLWNREMAERAAVWVDANRSWHPSFYRILAELYRSYPMKAILESICRLLVGGRRLSPLYREWYALGIREDIPQPQLYEYYLCTLPESPVEPLPKLVALYYSYNSPQLPSAKRALYRCILQQYSSDSQIYRLYEKQMREYALEQLLAGEVRDDLAPLYGRMFIPEVLDKKTAPILLRLLHTEHIRTSAPGMRGIAVLYPELKEEAYFPLKNGEANIAVYEENCRLLFENERGERYENVPAERRRLLFGNEELLRACVSLCPDAPFLRLRDCRRLLTQEPLTAEDYAALTEILSWKELAPSFRLKLLAHAAGQILPGDAAGLAFLQQSRNSSYLDEDCARVLLESFIRLDETDSAVELVQRFGCRQVRRELLLELVGKRIRRNHYAYEDNLFAAALYLYRSDRFSAVTLTYLCRYYNGGSRDMRELLRECIRAHGIVYDLPERLLGQMLFTGGTEELEWVCGLYLENAERPDRLLTEAYAVVQSDRYFRGGIRMPERLPEYLKLWAFSEKRPEYLPTVCQLALVRYYAKNGLPGEQDQSLAQLLVRSLYRRGMVFRFEKELAGSIELPAELTDRTLIEYHGEPEGPVEIGLRILPEQEDEEPVWTEMPCIYRGIYTRPVLLFTGETAEYEIAVTENGQRVTLEKGTVRREERDGRPDNRFRKLNALLKGLPHCDDPAWQQLLMDYGREDVILKNYFTIL